jgi:hypothetical protein
MNDALRNSGRSGTRIVRMRAQIFGLAATAVMIVGSAASAEDIVSPPDTAPAAVDAKHKVKPTKAPKKAKSAAKAEPEDLNAIPFSQPYGDPAGEKAKAAAESKPRPAPEEPKGGVSVGLQWHATNDKVDPWDGIRHTSGPDGPGDAVEGGVKLGF